MATICLNMIVKDEATIIKDTLENILTYVPIDYWVIADTGSTDNTAEIITSFFECKNIKGKLLHHQWKNFGYNRQLALDVAQGLTDYVLFFDADDRFIGDQALIPNLNLVNDAYAFPIKNDAKSSYTYHRYLLVRNNGYFKWRGAVHEQIINTSSKVLTSFYLDEFDITVLSGRFGARNQNANKLLNDIQLLEVEYNETDDLELKSQDAYFCAQSYRDMGNAEKEYEWLAKTLELLTKRSIYRHYTLMCLADNQKRQMKYEPMLVYLQQAFDDYPNNAEPLIHLAKYFLECKNFKKAFLYASKSIYYPIPELSKVVTLDYALFYNERYRLFFVSALSLGYYSHIYEVIKYLISQPFLDKINSTPLKIMLDLPEIRDLIALDTTENQTLILTFLQSVQ